MDTAKGVVLGRAGKCRQTSRREEGAEPARRPAWDTQCLLGNVVLPPGLLGLVVLHTSVAHPGYFLLLCHPSQASRPAPLTNPPQATPEVPRGSCFWAGDHARAPGKDRKGTGLVGFLEEVAGQPRIQARTGALLRGRHGLHFQPGLVWRPQPPQGARGLARQHLQ